MPNPREKFYQKSKVLGPYMQVLTAWDVPSLVSVHLFDWNADSSVIQKSVMWSIKAFTVLSRACKTDLADGLC